MTFEQHTPGSRKNMARLITAVVALVLLVLLVVVTVQPRATTSTSPLQNFYTTILTTGQSYIGQK